MLKWRLDGGPSGCLCVPVGSGFVLLFRLCFDGAIGVELGRYRRFACGGSHGGVFFSLVSRLFCRDSCLCMRYGTAE